MQAICAALVLSVLAFAPDSPISNGVIAPVATYKPEPNYPQEAKDAGIQGEVWLSTVIDEKGIPTEISVTRALEPSLDKEAIATLVNWRFKPGMKYGQAVAVKVTVAISFHFL